MLKNILKAFVEIEEKPKPKTEVKEVEMKSQPVYVETQAIPLAGSMVAEVNSHFEEILEEANKNNFPGTDFYEFYRMKEALNMLPLEEMRYSAAFQGLAATGLTKDKLLTTAAQYNEVLDREMKDFEDSYNQMYDQEVTAKKKLMEQKATKLQELSVQLQKLDAELKQLNTEILNSDSTLQGKKQSFVLAGQAMKDKIATEINKINTYIK